MKKNNIIDNVIRLMKANPEKGFTLNEIEAETGLSRSSIATAINRESSRFQKKKRIGGKGRPEYEFRLQHRSLLSAGMAFSNSEPNYIIKPEYKELASLVGLDAVPAIFILGGAKYGKTSLINRLVYEIRTSSKANDYAVIHIDFERISNVESLSESNLYAELINQAKNSLPDAQIFFSHAEPDRDRVLEIRDSFLNTTLFPIMPESDFAIGGQLDRIGREIIEKTDVFLFFLSKKCVKLVGDKCLKMIQEAISLSETGRNPLFIPVLLEPCQLPDSFKNLEAIDLYENSSIDLKFSIEKHFDLLNRETPLKREASSTFETPEWWAREELEAILRRHLEKFSASRVLLIVDGLDFIFEHISDKSWADGIVSWLSEIRNRMNHSPYNRIQMLTAMSLMSYASLYSKPLLTQNKVIRMRPFSETEISKLLEVYDYQEKKEECASRLLAMFNGQPHLTHYAIERIVESGDGLEQFAGTPYLSLRDFQLYWSRIKDALSLSIKKGKTKLTSLLEGIVRHNDSKRESTSLYYRYYEYLILLGIIDLDGNISCDYYAKMLDMEIGGLDD